MRKPVLTIFYQFNPWLPSVGGIQTLILNFVKFAPPEFELKLVGLDTKSKRTIGVWQDAELYSKRIQFMPLFKLVDDNVRHIIPTTLKFTAALLKHQFSSDFMHFHRLEPTLASRYWVGRKTFFIHNDIQKQISAKGGKNAILWQRLPVAYFALERMTINQFDHILSCNTNSLKFYQQRYPAIASRISSFRNTVDNDVFYPLCHAEREQGRKQLTQKLNLSENTQFILFVGRFHPQKDPLLLIQSLTALEHPFVHLVMVGAGEMMDQIKNEINRFNLSQKVTLLGTLTQADVAALQQVCCALVLTSHYEGLPMVVLETLACGTPVVTTACGETPNLLSNASGIVCQERTPQAIAKALQQVLLYPAHYSTKACTQAAEPYRAETVIGEVYKQMWQEWSQSIDQRVP